MKILQQILQKYIIYFLKNVLITQRQGKKQRTCRVTKKYQPNPHPFQ